MRNVIILGAGGAGAEVTFYIEDHNSKVESSEQLNILGYLDDSEDNWRKYQFQAPLIGSLDAYEPKEEEEVLIAIGDMKTRKILLKKLIDKNAKIGSFIHCSVVMPKNLDIGIGNIVFPFCILEK